jgi:lipoyl-dependent peroxiredoxin
MTAFSRRSEFQWVGNIVDGAGRVTAGTDAFVVPVTFPSTRGESTGKTTPEELLAASHATCYGIGLCSLIERRGGRARRVMVTATVTAEKGPRGITIQSSHLAAQVEALESIDDSQLQQIALETEGLCTISIALRGNIDITHEVAQAGGSSDGTAA